MGLSSNWEFLLPPQPPQIFLVRGFEALFPPHWNRGLHGLFRFPVVPPGLSACKCGTTCSASRCITQSLSCCFARGPLCPTACHAPPTGLNECFFFNSLVVGLPYSSIFCQFWWFFVFKFVVFLLMVVRGGTVCLPMPPSWLEVSLWL